MQTDNSATTHNLKTWPEYFAAMKLGIKKFELRVNDRNFKVGDILRLEEWHPDVGEYTGRSMLVRVTFLIQGAFGLPDNTCVMSTERYEPFDLIETEEAGDWAPPFIQGIWGKK